MQASLLLISLLITGALEAEPDCGVLQAAAEQAASAGDIASLKSGHSSTAACSPTLGDWVGRRIAMAEYNAATAAKPVDEARLIASLAYGRPWQTLATLGELAAGRKDRGRAAQLFQEALVEIGDTSRTPKAPPEEVINAIRKKAEVAALLAPRYVAIAKARDGSSAGLGAVSIRGLAVRTTAIPVWFAFGTAEPDTEGRKAADDLAEMLKSQKPAAITLVGHTDAAGDAVFNQKLSLARAQQVAAYVKAKGVTTAIKVIGRGEEEPFQADDPSSYTSDELARMSRRVELRRE